MGRGTLICPGNEPRSNPVYTHRRELDLYSMTIYQQRDLSRAARLLGRKGGHATAQRLTSDQRRANAQKAVAVRWARQREIATATKAKP